MIQMGGINLDECLSIPNNICFLSVNFLKDNILAVKKINEPHFFHRVCEEGKVTEQLDGEMFDSKGLIKFTCAVEDTFVALIQDEERCNREFFHDKAFFRGTNLLIISSTAMMLSRMSRIRVNSSLTHLLEELCYGSGSYIYRISTKEPQK